MAVVRRGVAWLAGRRGAVLVLAAAWVMIVAVSSGAAAEGEAWIGLPSTEWLGVLVLVAGVIGAVLLVVGVITQRGSGAPVDRRRRPVWLMFLFLGFLLLLPQGRLDNLVQPEGPPPEEPVAPPRGDLADSQSGLGGIELALLVTILVLAVAVLVWSRRYLQDDPGDDVDIEELDGDESLETVLGPAIEEAGQRLLTGSDPGSAVLVAYAALEAALTRAGQPPADHETPSEHLRRVLRYLSVDPEPLFRLAELYHLARFSGHAITAEQQRDAAEALGRIRSQLAVAR